jgi:hypothetical protein
MHGEDDQIVPVKDSAVKSARLIKGAKEWRWPLPIGERRRGRPRGNTSSPAVTSRLSFP